MNRSDEEIRGIVNDALSAAGIDVRHLAVEVDGGSVTVAGTVPDEMQRRRAEALAVSLRPSMGDLSCRIDIRPVAPSDSSYGHGRSPVTGTPADSAHESRHLFDE